MCVSEFLSCFYLWHGLGLMLFHGTFNNTCISIISWWLVWLMEENGVDWEEKNDLHQVHFAMSGNQTYNFSCDRHWLTHYVGFFNSDMWFFFSKMTECEIYHFKKEIRPLKGEIILSTNSATLFMHFCNYQIDLHRVDFTIHRNHTHNNNGDKHWLQQAHM